MFCKKCNAPVDDGVCVCPECGAELEPDVPKEETPAEELPVVLPENAETTETGSEPAEEVQQEEKPVVKKRRIWVKVTAAVVCAVLFLGLIWYGINGGFVPRTNDVHYKDQYSTSEENAVKAANKVVATVGGRELTNAQLQVFYWMGVYEFVQNYGGYLSYFGLDMNKPLSEQYAQEGETWEQYFLENALNTWHNYQSLLIYGEKDGYELSDELVLQLDEAVSTLEASLDYYGFANLDEMIQADMGPSANEEAYRYYMATSYGGMEYFEGLYDQFKPSLEEIEEYYNENAADIESTYNVDKNSGKLIDVRHILVCPTGGTTDENNQVTYSEAEWEACRTTAEAYLEQWKNGGATEAAFAELAMQITEDSGSANTGGLYTYVYQGQMTQEFNDWCFDDSRQPGDTGLVKTSYGYHIMYFVYGDEGWIRRAESDMVTKACSDVMEQAMELYPMKVNYKNIAIGKATISNEDGV